MHVHVRGLPFYSDLLTILGPAAAQELTQCNNEGLEFEGALYHPWRDRLGLSGPAYACKDGGDDPGRRGTEALGQVRGHDDGTSSSGRDRTRSMSFGREMDMIEEILRRRECLGVERWLQLQRCAAYPRGGGRK